MPKRAEGVDAFLEGRAPVVAEVYDALVKGVRKFGPRTEEPKKTSVHLVRRTAFAGFNPTKSTVSITIRLSHDIESPRIAKREQASANRWHLDLKIASPREVDAELLGWLREAYELAG